MKALVPIILLVLSGGVFFGYTDGAYTEIKGLQAQKATYEDALNNAKIATKKFDTLQQLYNSIPPEEVGKIAEFLPDNIDNIRLILDISNIASRHGMVLKTVSIDKSGATGSKAVSTDPSAQESGVGTISLSFTVNTTYDGFLAFIKDVEKSMRLVDIISLTAKAPDAGKAASDYGVSVKTYWLK